MIYNPQPTTHSPQARLILLASLLAFNCVAFAQEISGISLKQAEVGIGEEVELTVLFKPKPNYQNCGVQIDFGDGTKVHHRIDGNQPSITIAHKYQQAGAKFIQVEGKTKFQGLATTFNCLGEDQKIALNVNSEDLSAQRAASIAAKKRALDQAKADESAAVSASNQAKSKRAAAEASAKQAQLDKVKAEKAATLAAKASKPSATQPATSATKPAIAAPQPPAEDKKPSTKGKSILDL